MKTTAEYSLVPYDPGRILPDPRRTGTVRFPAPAAGAAAPKRGEPPPGPARQEWRQRSGQGHPTYSFHRTIEHPTRTATGLVVDIFV